MSTGQKLCFARCYTELVTVDINTCTSRFGINIQQEVEHYFYFFFSYFLAFIALFYLNNPLNRLKSFFYCRHNISFRQHFSYRYRRSRRHIIQNNFTVLGFHTYNGSCRNSRYNYIGRIQS